ncbi:MAG TPA: biotin/lipoyl-binding protein, partial [Gammaproteobacteria bacterium]
MNPCLRAALLSSAFIAATAMADPADPPPPVTWQPLSAVRVQAEREAPAAALSLNESRIASEVTARVRAIPVQVGEEVEADAVLVELEPQDAELALQRAQAALDSVQARIRLAEFQLQRARELHKRNFASEDTLTQRETELDVLRAERAGAEAQVASARRELAKCTVRAP